MPSTFLLERTSMPYSIQGYSYEPIRYRNYAGRESSLENYVFLLALPGTLQGEMMAAEAATSVLKIVLYTEPQC